MATISSSADSLLTALPLAASPDMLFGSAVQETAPQQAGIIMAYTQGLRGFSSQHEQFTRMEVVRRLALLKRYRVADEFAQQPGAGVYLVPSDTLVGSEHAAALGVRGRDDLFGGVVPHAFIATKAITHPLVSTDAAGPEGWRRDFHPAIRDAVLRGHSAFSIADAATAGRRLLAQHKVVRVKMVHETGGRGQTVVATEDELDACLQTMDAESVERYGLVIEQNLDPAQTLSIGQVVVAGITASYYGQQHMVTNNHGKEVYGGSELHVVRGDLASLLAYEMPETVRIAVEQAMAYNSAVSAFYPGFFASRINYDIAQGEDAAGVWCSGVLEQSWRIGGASGAEVAALEVLAAEPERNRVHTRCYEAYGTDTVPPRGAAIYFDGVDGRLGPMTKYATVLPDGDTA